MIGYYAHHLGAGHLWRGATLARHLSEPVTLLSSASPPDQGSFTDAVALASDADDVDMARDPSACGALHWAPLHDRGLQTRMAQVAEWVRLARPSVIVADVSVEVTTLARLLGVPVVVVAMPGDRDDPAHQWGYRLASRVIAPWTREIYDPSWLHPHDGRVDYVGAFSRFTHRAATPGHVPFRAGLVLTGAGGSSLAAAHVKALEASDPSISWDVVGGPAHWRDDVWSALCAADVVVSHAGQNAVAEIAAARRPAVLVPEPRPHDEQLHAVAALSSSGLVRAGSGWAEAGEALTELSPDPASWARWAPAGAVAAAARTIEDVAASGRA